VSLAQWRGRDQDATLIQIKIKIEIAGAACPVGDLSQPRALPDNHEHQQDARPAPSR
jgi:hypothetical protein